MGMAIKHILAFASGSIPYSSSAIPTTADDFFWNRLTQTIDIIFMSFKNECGVALAVDVHNPAIFSRRVKPIVFKTRQVRKQLTYSGWTARTKSSWYTNSRSNVYFPDALSIEKSLADLSMDPETSSSVPGRTARHLTDP